MPKPNNIFKSATNSLLRYVAGQKVGAAMPSESKLADICNVSRTTVRAALAHVHGLSVLKYEGMTRIVARRPREKDYFGLSQVQSQSEKIERKFMERVLTGDLRPGQQFSEAELAREVGTSTATVREFLIRFSRFGLIEKRPRGGWVMRAFDRTFGQELADIREMFEMAAIRRFANAPEDPETRMQIDSLIDRHRAIEADIDTRYRELAGVDRELHRLIIEKLGNRFASGFYDVVSFVFHYHYQWDLSGEKERHLVAVREHLALLEALRRRDFDTAMEQLATHLATARRTLLQAIHIGEQAPVVSRRRRPARARLSPAGLPR